MVDFKPYDLRFSIGKITRIFDSIGCFPASKFYLWYPVKNSDLGVLGPLGCFIKKPRNDVSILPRKIIRSKL